MRRSSYDSCSNNQEAELAAHADGVEDAKPLVAQMQKPLQRTIAEHKDVVKVGELIIVIWGPRGKT